MFDRELGELGGGPKIQLLHETILVKFHGSGRQIQNRCSLLGRTSFSQKLQDLPLPRRKLCCSSLRHRPTLLGTVRADLEDTKSDIRFTGRWFIPGGDADAGAPLVYGGSLQMKQRRPSLGRPEQI